VKYKLVVRSVRSYILTNCRRPMLSTAIALPFGPKSPRNCPLSGLKREDLPLRGLLLNQISPLSDRSLRCQRNSPRRMEGP